MEPLTLCNDECELSPDTCGFYNVDTDECTKTEETEDGNTETQEEGTNTESEESNEDSDSDDSDTETEEETESTEGNNPLVDSTPETVDEEPVVKLEDKNDPYNPPTLIPPVDRKDDPNYFYDGVSGEFKEKSPDYIYGDDGSITLKSANDQ